MSVKDSRNLILQTIRAGILIERDLTEAGGWLEMQYSRLLGTTRMEVSKKSLGLRILFGGGECSP